jgi:hypothetical protein
MTGLARLARAAAPWSAAALALALVSCESSPPPASEARHPAVSAATLGISDTAGVWAGGARPPADSTALGLVVLWDGTDPACLATLPAIEAWHEAYARFGLRVTGVHFAGAAVFADSAAVARASSRLGLRFASAVSAEPVPAALAAGLGPVVILREGANGFSEWVTDAGDASRVEERLRTALRGRTRGANFPGDAGAPPAAESERPPRWRRVLIRPGPVSEGPLADARLDVPQPFTVSFRFQEEGAAGIPVPVGWWTPRADGLEAARGGPANFLAIRYDAARVGLVMAPPAAGSARVWVLQDEHWIAAAAAGEDVKFDARGAAYVEVHEPRLYWITRGGSHVLKLSPDVPGMKFHAFSFEAVTVRR